MTTSSEALVRSAFEALARGELDAMLELVDPDLEWTFLDPTEVDPQPQICRGRDQLAYWVGRDSGWRIRPELEELISFGERVLVVTRSAGIDERRARKTRDRNFHVVTVRNERIKALRACRSREEALSIVSQPPSPPAVDSDEAAAESLLRLAAAIRAGDVDAVRQLIADRPELATMREAGANGKTALHVATDWPGFFPKAPAIVRLLIGHGADPDARAGRNETPLHWAASSGDAEVAEALVAGGADLNAPDGSIGTPVENAVGYGCFDVARLLVAHGASVETLWVASALGMRERLEELLASRPIDQGDLDEAFWHACSGGQRRVAEYLFSLGADVNATPGYSDVLALDRVAALDTERQSLVEWLKSVGARSQGPGEDPH